MKTGYYSVFSYYPLIQGLVHSMLSFFHNVHDCLSMYTLLPLLCAHFHLQHIRVFYPYIAMKKPSSFLSTFPPEREKDVTSGEHLGSTTEDVIQYCGGYHLYSVLKRMFSTVDDVKYCVRISSVQSGILFYQ